MSNQKTSRTGTEILESIDAKLTALLALIVRSGSVSLEGSRIANGEAVNFLAVCGLENEDIANILGSTKESVRVMRTQSKGKKKKK